MIENDVSDFAQLLVIHAVNVRPSNIFGLRNINRLQRAVMCHEFLLAEMRKRNKFASSKKYLVRESAKQSAVHCSPWRERKSDLARILWVRLSHGHVGIFGRINWVLNRRRGRFGGNAKQIFDRSVHMIFRYSDAEFKETEACTLSVQAGKKS